MKQVFTIDELIEHKHNVWKALYNYRLYTKFDNDDRALIMYIRQGDTIRFTKDGDIYRLLYNNKSN